MNRLLQALAGVSVLALAGCATPIVKTTGPLAIREVQVTAAPTLKSETDVLGLVRQTLPPQLVGTRAGQSTRLDVTLTQVHYKNPVASILIGDDNRLLATVVAYGDGNAEIARFDAVARDQTAIDGIAGAVIAVAQDRARVDRALAMGLAMGIERQIYGNQLKPVMRPELAQPIPQAAPATTPAAGPPRPAATAPAPRAAGV